LFVSGTAVKPESYAFTPLSRPIYIYTKKDSLQRPEVLEYVKYYLSPASRKLILQVGYVAAPDKVYADGLVAIIAAAPK
jgi:phosphate transport system substrate-binding protein